jgi:hypothetical protein
VSEKSHDGRRPTNDSSGCNDKDSNPASGSDNDSTVCGTNNGTSRQRQAIEDKQVGVHFLQFLVCLMIRKKSLAIGFP